MPTQILRDTHGRPLAQLQTHSDGRQTIRDSFGRLLGNFDPKQNVTRDSFGRLVGTGNILASLI